MKHYSFQGVINQEYRTYFCELCDGGDEIDSEIFKDSREIYKFFYPGDYAVGE